MGGSCSSKIYIFRLHKPWKSQGFFLYKMNRTQLTFKEFEKLATKPGTIQVYKRILADLLTPVSAWVYLSQTSNYAFLLESVEKGNQHSRYSYVGINPQKIFIHKNGQSIIHENGESQIVDTPFIDLLRQEQSRYKTQKMQGIPSFTGGLVGYLGYETISWVEDVPIHKSSAIDVPDSVFMLFEDMIAFDHLKGSALVIANINIHKEIDLKEQFDSAHHRIDSLGEKLHTYVDYQTPVQFNKSKVSSNFTQKFFESAVLKAKDYIVNGDVFQTATSSGGYVIATASGSCP